MNLNEEQLEKTQKIIADDNFVYMGDNFFIMDIVNAIKAGYRLNRLDEETEETKEAKRQSVLNKIRAEIESQREEASNKHSEDEGLLYYYFGLNDGLKDARDILDKYRVESEE